MTSLPRSDVRALRVALDTTYAGVNPTGVGLYSARLAATLRREANSLGLELTCYGPACRLAERGGGLLGTMQEWPTYTHGVLPVKLMAAPPSVVHSTSHIGPTWGPGRLVITVHDLIFLRYPGDYNPVWLAITRALLPRVLRRARAIVADSETTKRDLVDLCAVRPRKVAVVYPGVDDAFREVSPLRTRSRPYVLLLGPWVRRKNLEVVVRSFAGLCAVLPEVRLVITGQAPRGMRGQTESKLLAGLSSEVRDRIDLLGYVPGDRLVDLVRGAALLAYPSRFEGFGLPPLEAMCAGVPVVASNTPVVAEVTAGAALLCPPDDLECWASTMQRVLTDVAEEARLREAGLLRSAAFTWERCAAQTAMVYRRVARAG